MQLETFPTTTSFAARRKSPEPRFVRVGVVWEMRLIAEAYDRISAPNLIISDGLAYLTDRMLRDCDYDSFVRIGNPADDGSDVFVAAHLLEDLREGCALLSRAVRNNVAWEDAFLGLSNQRIHESSAELVRAACRRIVESF